MLTTGTKFMFLRNYFYVCSHWLVDFETERFCAFQLFCFISSIVMFYCLMYKLIPIALDCMFLVVGGYYKHDVVFFPA